MAIIAACKKWPFFSILGFPQYFGNEEFKPLINARHLSPICIDQLIATLPTFRVAYVSNYISKSNRQKHNPDTAKSVAIRFWENLWDFLQISEKRLW
jgi:hypothetical protein